MSVEGVNARRFKGSAVEPMGEFVQLAFEADDGSEFLIRLPASEAETIIPKLLTLPGRVASELDPVRNRPSALGTVGAARSLRASATKFRTDVSPDVVLLEIHIGKPPFPVFFSLPRDAARQLVDAAAADLSKPADKP